MKFYLLVVALISLGPGPSISLISTAPESNKKLSENTCLNELNCIQNPKDTSGVLGSEVLQCTSHYGGFPDLAKSVEELINKQLGSSMKLLLLSTRFDHWKTQRKGFHSYIQKLSDAAWDDAVTLIEEVAKRGGSLTENFGIDMPEGEDYHLTEIEALSKALDLEKDLAKTTEDLMHHSFHENLPLGRSPDPAFAHFLAEKISGNQADRIRNLAGHVRNLGSAMSSPRQGPVDLNLILYLYDKDFMG